jgi:hypothetical protein
MRIDESGLTQRAHAVSLHEIRPPRSHDGDAYTGNLELPHEAPDEVVDVSLVAE